MHENVEIVHAYQHNIIKAKTMNFINIFITRINVIKGYSQYLITLY